jgi:hypothetical protein
LSIVGCGGFGPATTGVATIASAAANEPAIVAVVKTLLEFIADPFQKLANTPASSDNGQLYSNTRTLPVVILVVSGVTIV